MDALASILFTTIVIAGVLERGYKGRSMLLITLAAGLVACFGLACAYGGLSYIGACSSSDPVRFPPTLTRTQLLVKLTDALWGNLGTYILAAAIALACLTTAIGMTATAAKYFSDKFADDISYRATTLIIVIISFFLSTLGVDSIIRIAGPVLEIMYPIAIVFIILNLFDKFIPNSGYYVGAVIGAVTVSLLQVWSSAQGLIQKFFTSDIISPSTLEALNFEATAVFVESLPLEKWGFPWVVPAVITSIVFGLVCQIRKSLEAKGKEA